MREIALAFYQHTIYPSVLTEQNCKMKTQSDGWLAPHGILFPMCACLSPEAHTESVLMVSSRNKL